MPCCKDDSSQACACRSPSGSNLSAPTLVPLSHNGRPANLENSHKPPVWAINSVADEQLVAPLPSKCDRNADVRNGVCCKELRSDDERTLVDPDVVRDVVIGLSDGLTVPFALTAGLSSIGSSKIVVLGGLAELIAGAISMGVGGFLASQSERDYHRYLRTQTRERVQRSCDGEMEREVHAVLGPLGVEEKLSVQIADCLRRVEDEMHASGCDPAQRGKFNGAAGIEGGNSQLKWSQDVGLTAFLLKFGEGLEEVPTRRLYISAFTIGMGYFVGGLVPLVPYFFIDQVHQALLYSCIVTGIILLIFGAVKTHVTGATGGWGGYAYGAFSMLAVGGGAAAAAFGIVRALES